MQGLAKTRTPNLWRHPVHKTYYAVTRVGGKSSRAASLKTDSEAIAKLRLPKKLAELRASRGKLSGANVTLGEAAAAYVARLRERMVLKPGADEYLKPRAVNYRESTLVGIRATWPEFDATPGSAVDEARMLAWSKVARPKYSPARFNGMLQSLRAILSIVQEQGGLESVPGKAIKHSKVRTKELQMLTPHQVQSLFAVMKRRRSKAYWLCRFLYHFSLRIGTARQLTPAMANRAARRFEIPGELVKGGRAGEIVRVPIFPEMEELLAELDRKFGKGRKLILPVPQCHKALRRACEAAKVPVLNHHAWRHIFTSHALENGIDVRTLADWRNDADGGAFLLKWYSHIVDVHAQEKASQLRFKPEDNVVEIPLAKRNHG